MKYLVISVIIFLSIMFLPSYAIETFDGTAKIENLDSVVAGEAKKFNVRMSYTRGTYTFTEMTPIIEIMPSDARKYVNITIEPLDHYVTKGSIARFNGILDIDPSIPYQKIFLTMSFSGKNIFGQNVTSVFNDSIIISIQNPSKINKVPSLCCGEPTTIKINDFPLKQFKSGLAPADVICKSNLVLVIKSSTGNPDCVKLEHSKRLLSNGWFSVPSSDRAIRPLVTIIDKPEDLGIKLTNMQVIPKQDYGTFHEDNLQVSAFQGILSDIPTVVSKITNVSNKTIVLNQVLATGSIITSNDSTTTQMYADAIGCSVSHWKDGVTTCPYPAARHDPLKLSPNESFVFYFSDDFTHKLGPISKITVSIWYDKDLDEQHHRTEIDYTLGLIGENYGIPALCHTQTLFSNSSGVFLKCNKEISKDTVYDLPDTIYKREPCNSTHGCISNYVWMSQIPENIISEKHKQQIVEKLMQLPETKNWPAKPILDHFYVGTVGDIWEANVQFFIPGYKLPQHNKCEFYDSANVDLETLEVINGFRNFTNFEKCE